MLMDHGAPWWNTSNGWGLTRLSVDLIKQGIDLIYGRVRHPQTQGKVERFHRTLKDSVAHQGQPQPVGGVGRIPERLSPRIQSCSASRVVADGGPGRTLSSQFPRLQPEAGALGVSVRGAGEPAQQPGVPDPCAGAVPSYVRPWLRNGWESKSWKTRS